MTKPTDGGSTPPEFTIGDRVWKFGGEYGGPGEAVGITVDLNGKGRRLYAIAMKVEGGYGRFVHVFPASVLRLEKPEKSAPPTDPEGWIPHDGGPMPCESYELVDFKLRSGLLSVKQKAGMWGWSHYKSGSDVIAWRPARTE